VSRLQPTRLSWRDVADEALAGLVQRPGRSVMTMLGTILGIGALVAILGFTATAQGQISKQFSVLSATQITVTGGPFPSNASARAEEIDGVVSAGVYWSVAQNHPGLQVAAAIDPSIAGADAGIGLDITAAGPSALSAMGAKIADGRLYNEFAQSRAEPVAVLGAVAARRLGITQVGASPAVFVSGVSYTVVGIIGSFSRLPGQLLSVIIPSSTALARYGVPKNAAPSMLVTTRLGAAQVVARQIPVVLNPSNPGSFRVSAPADPTKLQRSVYSSVNRLILLLAVMSLLIGTIGIVNTTMVSVMERTGEIGLRRALGARPRQIAAQFLAESLAIGTMGGLIGTASAVLAVLVAAVLKHQTAVIPPWAVLPAPFAGSLIGLLAGIYPAVRASRLEPVAALQR
jgi:putative ABC transport system permease protein